MLTSLRSSTFQRFGVVSTVWRCSALPQSPSIDCKNTASCQQAHVKLVI